MAMAALDGAIMMLLGITAILLPFVATMTIEPLIAIILVVACLTQIVHAFKCQYKKGLALRLLAGALYGLVGILLMAFPLHGALTLTLLPAVMFAIAGAFKIALAIYKTLSKLGLVNDKRSGRCLYKCSYLDRITLHRNVGDRPVGWDRAVIERLVNGDICVIHT